MCNFLDLDFPFPPLYSINDLQYSDMNININGQFIPKLYVLPLNDFQQYRFLSEIIKLLISKDNGTIIFLVPTFNCMYNGFISFLPDMLGEINKNYNINYELLDDIQKDFSLQYADFQFEFSESLKFYFDYFKSIDADIKFLPLFFYDFDAGTVKKFLEKYYGTNKIILLSNLCKKPESVLIEDNAEKVAFSLEDNDFSELTPEDFSAYKFLPEFFEFNICNNYSLIRLCLANSEDKTTQNIGIWMLYEGSKSEYLREYYSKTVLDYIKFNLRRDLHLICGEEFILPEVFNEKFNVSVSIEINGLVRGVSPQDETYDILSKNLTRKAFGAAFSDDRFAPLKPYELCCAKFNVTLYSYNSDKKITIS